MRGSECRRSDPRAELIIEAACELRRCRRAGKKKTGEGRVSPVCRRLLGRRATCRRPADAMFASADAMRFGNDGIISSRSSRKQAARQEPESEFPACFVTFLTFSLPRAMQRARVALQRSGAANTVPRC